MRIAIYLIACLAVSASAQTMYKCAGPNGRTLFQDKPCDGGGEKITVIPASGRPAPTTVINPSSEADRLNALTDASQKERRKWDLERFYVPKAKEAIYRHKQECAEKQQALSEDRYTYVQNLYGKTHAAQRASEMAALSTQCDMKDRELKASLETLLTECKQLGCTAN